MRRYPRTVVPLAFGLVLTILQVQAAPPVSGFILYVADVNTGAIRQFNAAGQGSAFSNVGAVNPAGLAVDAAGNVYVANRSGGVSGTIDRVAPDGTLSVFSSDMDFPSKLAFDANGNLYAGMVGNNTISKFNASGQATTFASSGLNGPIPLAFDHNGNLYVGNSDNTIVRFGPNGQPQFFAASGLYPNGMTFDNAGNLYVANFGDNTIQKIDPAGNSTIFAGLGSGMNAPVDIAFDGVDSLYVLNLGNNTIMKLDLAGNATLFANTGLDHPESLAIRTVPEPSGLLPIGLLILALRHRLTKR